MDGEHQKKPDVELHVDPSSAYGFETTTLEKWSYIAYYIGNNGLSGFVYGRRAASQETSQLLSHAFPSLLSGPSQFQNLLALAAKCDRNGICTLPFSRKQQTGVRL
jgi:hypothetical protein